MTVSSYGFIDSSVEPDFEGTNSLLMKRPEKRYLSVPSRYELVDAYQWAASTSRHWAL
jgi:hypothetical protein